MTATRTSILALAACTLAACTGAPPQVDVAEEDALTVCPGASTVQGIDVSEFQGSINWSSVKAAGKQFAFIRVSDGTYQDPDFATNWANAKKAGLLRGAYQFFRASDDPITIADQFLARMGTLGAGDLPPTLDVEVTDGQSATTIRTRMEQWLAHVEQKTGRIPFIYVSPGFWPSLGSPNESHYRLWVANWGVSCPSLPSGWSTWQMWQKADNGSVSGISGAVDLDEFNGTLQQLNAIAGGSPYAAEYVSQSWPLASTPMQMIAGQTVAASITLKNTGTKTWDSNTKLGTTQPRDRASPFADSSWLSSSRAAHVTGTVAPGGTFKFSFHFHAPAKAGTYNEYFDLVQEGVAWFSDPGQGGPPDNQIEAQIVVSLPKYSAQFVGQSFPAADKSPPLTIGVGQSVEAWIDLKNVGSQTWKAGVTKLAPTPRDQASSLATSTWLSPTRVSTVAADVPPGQVGRFTIPLEGVTAGDYTQTFGLVDEGVTWFSDAANGGGPADDFLTLHLVVAAQPQDVPDGGAVADMSDAGSDDGGDTTGTGGNGDNGDNGDPTPTPPPAMKGCSFATDGAPSGFALLAVAAALLLVRRRARC